MNLDHARPQQPGRLIIAIVLAGLALLAVGYAAGLWSSGRMSTDPGGVAPSAGQTGNSPFTGLADPTVPYDQRVIDEMIMHHQGAIVSSRMIIGESQRLELRDLARRIQEGQQRQIDQMRAWR